jgi:hypothetical protein
LAIDQSNLPINSLKSVVANEYNPLEPWISIQRRKFYIKIEKLCLNQIMPNQKIERQIIFDS